MCVYVCLCVHKLYVLRTYEVIREYWLIQTTLHANRPNYFVTASLSLSLRLCPSVCSHFLSLLYPFSFRLHTQSHLVMYSILMHFLNFFFVYSVCIFVLKVYLSLNVCMCCWNIFFRIVSFSFLV